MNMNKKDEDYLFNTLEDIVDIVEENRKLLKENNIMLKQIIEVFRYYLTHANEENQNDFGRNVLANLISNFAELKVFRNK